MPVRVDYPDGTGWTFCDNTDGLVDVEVRGPLRPRQALDLASSLEFYARRADLPTETEGMTNDKP